jgi:TM2 domain-containing membrane protein YozV
MKGQILDYSVQTNSGVISTPDGTRYNFAGSEWKGDAPPMRGANVDFDVRDGNAVAVYRALGGTSAAVAPGGKDKTVAGLLAIFLGGLGIHKFYLGFTGPGLVFLLTNTVGWAVTWIMLGLPNIALCVIAVIEGIIYLTKSDEEFQQTYVIGKKQWF